MRIASFLLKELIQQEVTTMLVDNRIHTIGIKDNTIYQVEENKSKPSSPIRNAYETQGTRSQFPNKLSNTLFNKISTEVTLLKSNDTYSYNVPIFR